MAEHRMGAYKKGDERSTDKRREVRLYETVQLRKDRRTDNILKRRQMAMDNTEEDAEATEVVELRMVEHNGELLYDIWLKPPFTSNITLTVHQMRLLVSKDGEYVGTSPTVIDLLIDNGWMTVLGQLASTPGHAQKDAVWLLSNLISLEKAKKQILRLCQFGLIPVFVAAIQSPNLEIQEVGLYGAGNLMGEKNYEVAMSVAEQTTATVVQIWCTSHNPVVLDICTFFMRNLIYTQSRIDPDGSPVECYLPLTVVLPPVMAMSQHFELSIMPLVGKMLAANPKDRDLIEDLCALTLNTIDECIRCYQSDFDFQGAEGIRQKIQLAMPAIRMLQHIDLWAQGLVEEMRLGDTFVYPALCTVNRLIDYIVDIDIPIAPNQQFTQTYACLLEKVGEQGMRGRVSEYLILEQNLLYHVHMLLQWIVQSPENFSTECKRYCVLLLGNMVTESVCAIEMGMATGVFRTMADLNRKKVSTFVSELIVSIMIDAASLCIIKADLLRTLCVHLIEELAMLPVMCALIKNHKTSSVDVVRSCLGFFYQLIDVCPNAKAQLRETIGLDNALSDIQHTTHDRVVTKHTTILLRALDTGDSDEDAM